MFNKLAGRAHAEMMFYPEFKKRVDLTQEKLCQLGQDNLKNTYGFSPEAKIGYSIQHVMYTCEISQAPVIHIQDTFEQGLVAMNTDLIQIENDTARVEFLAAHEGLHLAVSVGSLTGQRKPYTFSGQIRFVHNQAGDLMGLDAYLCKVLFQRTNRDDFLGLRDYLLHH